MTIELKNNDQTPPDDSIRLQSAFSNSSEYPITSDEWFSKHRISRLNFGAMADIIRKNEVGGERILDVGCGNGLWSFGLFPRSFVTGIETSSQLLKFAKVNSSLSSCRFDGILLDQWRTPDDLFDVGLSIGVLELLGREEQKKHIELVASSVSSGAKVLFCFSVWRQFSAVYLPWFFRGGRKGAVNRTGIDISTTSFRELKQMVEGAGLSVIDAGGINPYPSKIWGLSSPIGFVTRNEILSHWYYSQFIVGIKG